MVEGRIERRDVLVAALGMGIAIAIGLSVFVLSGIYSVSAARPHYDPTTWLLDLIRKRSIWFHSLGIEPPPLDDPGLVRLGAAHFEAGCADCHGAPGRPANAVASAMLPEPPLLGTTVAEWETGELFWIVHNGQKYTGMPAWIAEHREDEVWPVVAFLRSIPGMTGGTYRELAGIEAAQGTTVPFGGLRAGFADLLADCARCHGAGGAHPVQEAVPVLAGQFEDYLVRSLREYRNGARHSGMMQLVASTLTDEEIDGLARYFGAQPPPPASPVAAPEPVAANPGDGEAIATAGVADQDVPACASCHDGGGQLGIPRLAGQPSGYLYRQLLLFRAGVRGSTAHGAIMAPIAMRLTDRQMRDVAAYFSSLGSVQ